MGIMSLLAALLPVFLIILTGYLVKKKLVEEEAHWIGLDRLNYFVLIPVLLITTLGDADLQALPIGDVVTVFLLAIGVVFACLGGLYYFRFRRASLNPSFTSVFQCSTRWNGFMALAIVVNLYGSEAQALIALAMIVLVPIINTINISIMTWLLTDEKVSVWFVLRKVMSNPIIIGCGIGIMLAATKLPIWSPVWQTMEILGRATLALLLISVGAGLSFSSFGRGFEHIAASSFLKLIVNPAIVLVLALALQIEGEILLACVIAASVPTAANGYVMAKQMGGNAPLYANVCSMQVILSFLTIPLWIEGALFFTT